MKLISSPWGRIQDLSEVVPGVVSVSTASHGGFYVDDKRLAKLPESVRNAKRFNPPGNWYEEDCEVLIIMAAFPDVAAALGTKQEAALASLQNWYPEIAKALTD